VKHAVVVEAPAAAAAPAVSAGPAPSQSALVRDALEHPLVAHARSVLDAAIRKVEPARQAAPATPPRESVHPVSADDELDHRDDDVEPDLDPVLRGSDADG
jgi:hypothetical protein